MKKKYVLKNKKRFSAIILILAVIFVSLVSSTTAYGYKTPKYEKITVRAGDTLWSIAQKYIKQGDVRENVYNLQIKNNLTDATIYEGMEIKIPVRD
ncbi:MAG: LysM peptidoglycan-binding domain-containing protein [Clostridia bacterium]